MPWMSSKEVAAAMGKHEKTIRNWCRWGWIQAKPQPSGRGWLVKVDGDGHALPRG